MLKVSVERDGGAETRGGHAKGDVSEQLVFADGCLNADGGAVLIIWLGERRRTNHHGAGDDWARRDVSVLDSGAVVVVLTDKLGNRNDQSAGEGDVASGVHCRGIGSADETNSSADI